MLTVIRNLRKEQTTMKQRANKLSKQCLQVKKSILHLNNGEKLLIKYLNIHYLVKRHVELFGVNFFIFYVFCKVLGLLVKLKFL